MRIQLPIEWWLDVFDEGMPREELANKANQTSDSDFTAITQAWLHRYQRNVTLRDLLLDFDRYYTDDCSYIKKGAVFRPIWDQARQRDENIRLPIAQVPLPPNITSFHCIDIKYIDATLLEFLQKLRRLFTDVHINLPCRIQIEWPNHPEAMWQATRQSLPHLLPLFAVKSMHIGNHEDFTFLLQQFPATMNDATIIDIRSLPEELEPYHNWLMNRRADGEPRLLRSVDLGYDLNYMLLFRQQIQEHFLASSKPVSYIIRFRMWLHPDGVLNAEVQKNNTTGEQLIVSNQRHNRVMGIDDDWIDHELCNILFIRCALDVDAEWLERKKRWACEWKPKEKIINLTGHIECVLQDDQQPGPPPPAAEQPGTSSGGGGSTMEEHDDEMMNAV